MDQRREFVRLAMQAGANRRELCRRFGIHPDTAYKWLGRWAGGKLGSPIGRDVLTPRRTERRRSLKSRLLRYETVIRRGVRGR